MKKNFKKDDFAIFLEAAKRMKMTEADFCEHLGYARNTVAGWRVKEEIPRVVAVACELILERGEKGKTVERSVLVVTGETEAVDALATMATRIQGIRVLGRLTL